jgi:hypothetical protein
MKKSVVQRNASITTTTRKNRKIIMKKTVLALLVTAAISCGLFTEAKADSITFNGTITANNDSAAHPGNPTTLHFTNPFTVLGTPAPTGIFAGTQGSSVTMTDFTFTGNGATAVVTSPTLPFVQWSFGGYTFTLQSVASASTAGGAIAVNGAGFVSFGGKNYSGVWSISGTSGTQFNFVTTTVPDGGSAVALLGVALTGIEGLRRMLRRRSA